VFNLLRNSPSWEAFVSEVHGPSSSKKTLSPIQLESSWRPTSTASHASSRTKTGPWNCLMNAWPAVATGQPLNTEISSGKNGGLCRERFLCGAPLLRGTTLAWTPVIPLGIKEERDRRARLVVDHTWFLINQHTLEWTKEAMQFGGALYRIPEDLPRRP
jgi:hypothetical protein